MRTFLSFPIEKSVKNELKNIQQKIETKNMDPEIKWTAPENMHVTVKFIGQTEPGEVEIIRKIMNKSAENVDPFEYSFHKLDAFPDLENPSVVISKISEKGREGFELEQNLRGYLKKAGFEFDRKKWVPHITLGRVNTDDIDLKLPTSNLDFSWEVDRLDFMKSELTSEGPVYSTITSVNL